MVCSKTFKSLVQSPAKRHLPCRMNSFYHLFYAKAWWGGVWWQARCAQKDEHENLVMSPFPAEGIGLGTFKFVPPLGEEGARTTFICFLQRSVLGRRLSGPNWVGTHLFPFRDEECASSHENVNIWEVGNLSFCRSPSPTKSLMKWYREFLFGNVVSHLPSIQLKWNKYSDWSAEFQNGFDDTQSKWAA